MMQLKSATVKANITSILSKALTANSISIFIPMLMLEDFGTYRFRVDYRSFVGLDGYSIYEFVTSSNEAPTLEIDKSAPFMFVPQQLIIITATVRHFKCSTLLTEEIYDDVSG